jgi:hypothetical protein
LRPFATILLFAFCRQSLINLRHFLNEVQSLGVAQMRMRDQLFLSFLVVFDELAESVGVVDWSLMVTETSTGVLIEPTVL